MFTKTAAAAAIWFGLFLRWTAQAQLVQCVAYGTDLVVEGNTTASICLKTVAGGTPRTFSYQLFGSGAWKFDTANTVSAPSGGTLTVTNGVSGTEQLYSLTTSGLAITGPTPSSANYGQFVFCYRPDLNVTCMPSQFTQRVRLRVDPIVRLSESGPITQNGTTSVIATLGEVGANPTVGAVVNASCTTANGATISVSPASRTTTSNGSTQPFTITTSNLIVYGGSGNPPSGTCTFNTAAGSKSASINVQGQRISTVLSASPPSAALPTGSSSHTQQVTVSTNPVVPNAPVNVTCAGLDGGTGTPATASLTTNASGTATLNMTANNMVVVNPTTAPKWRCTFALGTFQATSTIVGVQLTRGITLTPNVITGPGTATIVATVSHPYPGFSVSASCTSSRPDVPVSVSPELATTNTQGRTTFTVSAPQLGFADADTAANPNPVCSFQLLPGGVVSRIYLPYSNACTATSMLPMPAACGNPQ
jgi:hypothetical protein